MEAALIVRSTEVRKPKALIGFLEWLIWGHMHNKRVVMLFGSITFDIIDVFAPGLVARNPDQPWAIAKVAAVRATGVEGKWTAAVGNLPTLNHFVIGVSSGPSGADGAAVVDTVVAPASCAKRAALRAGWILKPTVADGDCGPDAMAHHLCLPRDEGTWQRIREAIADFMFLNAGSEAWQQIAVACQEQNEASGDVGKGGLGAAPVPVVPPGVGVALPAPEQPAPPKPGLGAALEVPSTPDSSNEDFSPVTLWQLSDDDGCGLGQGIRSEAGGFEQPVDGQDFLKCTA